MDKIMIPGVTITPLKIILHPKGNIYHALKKSEKDFVQFGEAYFSTILKNEFKGWKKHREMIVNLIVPVGRVKFVIYNKPDVAISLSGFQEFIIGKDNYCRLTIAPNIWFAFQGLDDYNMILNISSIEHSPEENVIVDLNTFKYEW
jgi:dTDP-4-dehydrorhamnose 3,5-epimerase